MVAFHNLKSHGCISFHNWKKLFLNPFLKALFLFLFLFLFSYSFLTTFFYFDRSYFHYLASSSIDYSWEHLNVRSPACTGRIQILRVQLVKHFFSTSNA